MDILIDSGVGEALPIYPPQAAAKRVEIEKRLRETYERYNYSQVFTPHIAKPEAFSKMANSIVVDGSCRPADHCLRCCLDSSDR